MLTFVLRLPGFVTQPAIVVDAESFEQALEITGAPDGTTGNAVFPSVVEQMLAHGIAVRFVR